MYKKYIKQILPLFFLLLMPVTVGAQITVVDDLGQTLRIDKPASRIISLSPHLTENIYAIGAGDLLVGAVAYSDYPEPAKALPRVGDFANLNIERILSLSPDLVVAWMDGTSPAQVERLQQLGIPVLLESPDSFSEIAQSLRRLGVLSGRRVSAEAVAQKMEQQIATLQKEYTSRKRLTVFYQVWHQPLITANGSQLISQIVELCGGLNIFASRPEVAPRVSIESVIAANPDLILSGVQHHNPTWRTLWQSWTGMTSVRLGLMYAVDADLVHRSTLRAVRGAEQVCGLINKARETLKSSQ